MEDEEDDRDCGCDWCKANPEPPGFPAMVWDAWLEAMVKAHPAPPDLIS